MAKDARCFTWNTVGVCKRVKAGMFHVEHLTGDRMGCRVNCSTWNLALGAEDSTIGSLVFHVEHCSALRPSFCSMCDPIHHTIGAREVSAEDGFLLRTITCPRNARGA